MKVAVMSLGQTMGKSHFISVLAGVFSRSQQRTVSILSTGSAIDNIELVDVKVKNVDIANAHVFKAILDSAPKGDMALFDYGFRQGDERVYIYDIMNSIMEDESKSDLLIQCMKKLPSDLTLIEIVGDYKDEFNQHIIEEADCYLLLFDTSKKGLRLAAEYREKESPNRVQKTAFVLSRYNPVTIGEKKIHKTTNIPQRSMFQWPYNVQVVKMGYDGELNNVAYDLIHGEPTLVELREKMMEIMSFMFDSPARKIIRDVDRWSS